MLINLAEKHYVLAVTKQGAVGFHSGGPLFGGREDFLTEIAIS